MFEVKMDKFEFRKELQDLTNDTTRKMWNTFIWGQIAYDALDNIDPYDLSYVRDKKIRFRKDFSLELEEAKQTELFYSTFVYIYSSFDSYFSRVLEIIKNYSQENYSENDIQYFCSRDATHQAYLLNNIIGLNYPVKKLEYFNYIRNLRNIIVHNNGIVDEYFVERTPSNNKFVVGQKIYLDTEFEDLVKKMINIQSKIIVTKIVKIYITLMKTMNIFV